MASIKFDAKAGRARLFYRFAGQQFNRTIRVSTQREAERACALVEETIEDLKRGKLQMPPEADPAEFIFSGGRVSAKPRASDPTEEAEAKPPTTKWVFDTYFENLLTFRKAKSSRALDSDRTLAV